MRIFSGVLMATTILVIGGCSTTAVNPNYQQTTTYKGSSPYSNEAVLQQAGYQTSQDQTQAPAPVTYATNNQQAYTQQVYQDCISKESNRKLIGAAAGGIVGGLLGRKVGGDNKTLGTAAGAAIGGATGYGIADKTIRCDQVSAPTTQNQSAHINHPAQAVSYESQAAPTSPAHPAQGIQENTQSIGDAGTPGYYAVNGGTPPLGTPPLSTGQPQYAQIRPTSPQASHPAPVSTQTTFAMPTQILPPGTSRYRVIAGDTLYSLARTTCSSVAEIQRLNAINRDFYIRADDDIILPSGRCIQ